MAKTESASSSAPAQPDASGSRVAILGWGGDAAQACEFLDALGLEAAVLDAVSVDKLDTLRGKVVTGGRVNAARAVGAVQIK